jgi:MerR HTH family regulatory protein
MLKIGDFSSLAQVSIKTLRYYDERGLLSPVHIDPETGYRYYSASQISRLHRILARANCDSSGRNGDRRADAGHAPVAAGRTTGTRR